MMPDRTFAHFQSNGKRLVVFSLKPPVQKLFFTRRQIKGAAKWRRLDSLSRRKGSSLNASLGTAAKEAPGSAVSGAGCASGNGSAPCKTRSESRHNPARIQSAGYGERPRAGSSREARRLPGTAANAAHARHVQLGRIRHFLTRQTTSRNAQFLIFFINKTARMFVRAVLLLRHSEWVIV
jgi:hypothetical protein